MTLFRQIDEGDESIGLPPYNGGLFASEAAPLLRTARLTDKIVGDIIYDLSHTGTEGARHFVNYRDMSVQQLGSIYERLLEREPVRDDNGGIVVRPNPLRPQRQWQLLHASRARRPDRRPDPEAAGRRATEGVRGQVEGVEGSDHRPIAERHAELLALDPAEAVLDLKVLDPAMGSGHFLVTAVDFLSDYIAEVAEYAPAVPEWLDGEYYSPLVERVATIRRDILERAQSVGLGYGRGPVDRPIHHPADGAETLHLRRGQEPAHRRARQGVAVAAQLHGRGRRCRSWTTSSAAATPWSVSVFRRPRRS